MTTPDPQAAALVARLVVQLGASLTRAGHVAQRVDSEHLGYCSYRRESPGCAETRALLHETMDWLEQQGVTEPIPFRRSPATVTPARQPGLGLFEEAM